MIGYPLAYQYLTSLRPDSVPANADELLRMRGRGWLASYSIGNPAADRGVPLVDVFNWDTGIQAHAGTDMVDATVAITAGTLSNPLFRDDNDGRQIAARVSVHPVPGPDRRRLVRARAVRVDDGRAGRRAATATPATSRKSRGAPTPNTRATTTSFASKPWSSALDDAARPARHSSTNPLRSIGTSSRVATRSGRDSTPRRASITLVSAGRPAPATRRRGTRPVTRLEVGGGYSIQRNLLLKLSFQHNTRDGGRVRTATRWPRSWCTGSDGRTLRFRSRGQCAPGGRAHARASRRLLSTPGATSCIGGAHRLDSRARRAPPRRRAGRTPADRGRFRRRRRRGTCPIASSRSSTSNRRRAARSSRPRAAAR